MWLDRVETAVMKTTGFALLDLPDQLYRLSYEDGVTSQQMAEEIFQTQQPPQSPKKNG